MRETEKPAFIRNFIAGILSAFVTLSYSLSYGALIFSGVSLEAHVTHGLQAALMTAWIVSLVVALGSSFSFAVAGPEANATAILALMAAFTTDLLVKRGTPADSLLATLLALLMFSAIIIGAASWLIGFLRCGKLVRFLPYPVVGGFLAGTGFLILAGGYKVLTGYPLTFSNIYVYAWTIQPQGCCPAVAVAAALFVVPRFQTNVLVLPLVLVVGVGLFYFSLWLTDMSVATALSQQLMFPPLQLSDMRQNALTGLGMVDWEVLLVQWPNLLALMLVVIITIMLNATVLELATQHDANIDRELRANGLANMISGGLGGMVGYISISRSLLNFKAGATSRIAGLITSVLCAGVTFVFTPALAYFPRPVMAGLLIFLGLSILREWTWNAYFRLPLLEYGLILAILLLVIMEGLITGVGFGLLVASIFFVYNYSRASCVTHNFNSALHFSNKERSMEQTLLLRKKGTQAHTIALQGYIFFGTSSEVVETCRNLI
jgi:SulP family sulfate permease